MVWVEIWENSYNKQYDYVETRLANRYNEKFDKVIEFIKRNESFIIESKFLSSDRVKIVFDLVREDAKNGIFRKQINTTFTFNCTTKQVDKIRSVLDG